MDNKKPEKVIPVKMAIIIIVTTLLTGTLIMGGMFFYFHNKKQEQLAQEQQYEANLRTAVEDIISSSYLAEGMINIYSKFWGNAISDTLFVGDINTILGTNLSQTKKYAEQADYWEAEFIDNSFYRIDDFNVAISMARQHFEKEGQIKTLRESQENIASKMQSLNNPPAKYEDAYEIVFGLYGLYEEYVSLAITPSGSLIEFNKKTNDLSSNIFKKIKEFKVKIPLG